MDECRLLVLHLLQHEPSHIGGVVTRRDQSGGDRAGGRARHPLGLKALIQQVAERARQADALDAPALEHEVDALLILLRANRPAGLRAGLGRHLTGDVPGGGHVRSARRTAGGV